MTWWVASASAPRPGGGPAPAARGLDRTAQLRACPDRATLLDVEGLLRDHAVPQAAVARVLGRAAERRFCPRTLWAWADRYGADRLVLALDAGLAERRMRRHLEAGSAPDWDALQVFADLAAAVGLPDPELADPDVRPALDALDVDLDDWTTGADEPASGPLDLAQFEHLPPILAPGFDADRRRPARGRGRAA